MFHNSFAANGIKFLYLFSNISYKALAHDLTSWCI